MHPEPAGQGEPLLVYRPHEVNAETLKTEKLREEAAAKSSSSHQPSTINPPLPNSPISASQDFSISASTHTSLPEVVARAIPSLRCSTGTAARIDRDDDVTLHVAFFEWDLADSTSVLEAFRHLPDECMGSIGMTLIEKAPPRSFIVKGKAAEAMRQEENQKSKIINHQSSISPSSPKDQTLTFDHTVFRDPRGVVVHAFKGTWVSGANRLLGEGVRGGADQWRQIRWKSALKRFHPAYARVAQGAVRGIGNPDLAWEAFEQAMLKDLSFATR